MARLIMWAIQLRQMNKIQMLDSDKDLPQPLFRPIEQFSCFGRKKTPKFIHHGVVVARIVAGNIRNLIDHWSVLVDVDIDMYTYLM